MSGVHEGPVSTGRQHRVYPNHGITRARLESTTPTDRWKEVKGNFPTAPAERRMLLPIARYAALEADAVHRRAGARIENKRYDQHLSDRVCRDGRRDRHP